MFDRNRFSRLIAPLFLLVAFATPLFASGWTHDPGQGNPIVRAPRGQFLQGLIPDTLGGVEIIYCDPCSLYSFPYPPLPPNVSHAVHVKKNGDLDPTWPPASRVLPGLSAFGPTSISDGQGGMLLAWGDVRDFSTTNYDLYAHHLRADGTLDPAWPANGRALCTAIGRQAGVLLCPDGQHGMIAVWTDRRDSVLDGNDIYAMHVRANGTLDPLWPSNGRAIYSGPSNQTLGDIVEDGSGGAIVVWTDSRGPGPGTDIYAQHVQANGLLDPGWPSGGRGVMTATGTQQVPFAVTDGAGGAYVSWDDQTGPCALTRVRASGIVDPGWPSNGLDLDLLAFDVRSIQMVPDGHGGVLAVCNTVHAIGPSVNNVLVRHVLPNGSYDPVWPSGGVELTGPFGYTLFPGQFTNGSAVTDGGGGVIVSYIDPLDGTGLDNEYRLQRIRSDGEVDPNWIGGGRVWSVLPSRPFGVSAVQNGDHTVTIAWTDLRDSASTYSDVYAQRFTDDGHLGLAVPGIHAIRDVPNDQGGKATVLWYGSAYDTLPADPVSEYDVWRQLDETAAATALKRGARLASAGEAPRPGDLRARRDGVQDVFWEFVGDAPARGVVNYALTVDTRGDSTGADPARETYEVDVHLLPGSLNFIGTSDPDSGYSVDNLAPAAPTPFSAVYNALTGSLLSWGNNIEPDLAGYRLYRGATLGFTPSFGSRVFDGIATTFHDTGAPAYFKVSAYDRHGNEGPYSTVLSGGTVAVEESALPRELALLPASPNPAFGATSVRLELPRAAVVDLAVFDTQGRRVRELLSGRQPAGDHPVRWDGRIDSGGRAPAGLYFIRFSAENRTFERRVALLH